jgi:DNA-binding CsgD family transcriptional regulator
MAASGLLRERDLRALTAVIEDGLSDEPGEAMPWAVFHRLQQLFPGSAVEFDELDISGQIYFTEQLLDDSERSLYLRDAHRPGPEWWAFRGQFLPYRCAQRSGDVAGVARWSDFYTASELKNTPFHQFLKSVDDRYAPRYGIIVPLPGAATRSRRMALFRSNRDFTERDRLALQLLRPHLHEVFLDAERRRRGIPHLSRREREVLQLVSQGCSNADIARILFISVSTVRKHLENIFNRTGVRTRSAAAALALPSSSAFFGSTTGEEAAMAASSPGGSDERPLVVGAG